MHRHIAYHLIAVIVICAPSVTIYSNTLDAPFVWDDGGNIVRNQFIRITSLDLDQLHAAAFKSRSSSRPVANCTFALNYYFGKYNVRGYHIVNIAIHTANGILVYLLALITFDQLARVSHQKTAPLAGSTIRWMSLMAGCVYTAHPIQTQAVTYIVQRMTSLATMFYLLSLLLFLWGRRIGNGWQRWMLWTACLATWMLALGTKQITVTLPLVILLYEAYFFKDLRMGWLKFSPLYIVAIAVIVGAVAFIYLGGFSLPSYGRRDFTMYERVLTQFRVVVFYITLLLLPLPSRLNLLHHVSTSHSLWDPPTTILALGMIVGLLFLAIYAARGYRLISFCIFWFFINLIVESTIVPLEMIYEHRLYLPMFGFSLLVPCVLFDFLSQRRLCLVISSMLMITCLGFATYVRNDCWRDSIVFWTDVLAKNPLAYRAHNDRGVHYLRRGKNELAARDFSATIRVNPKYVMAHSNRGLANQRLGRLDLAVKDYSRAISMRPGNAAAYRRRGDLCLRLREYRRAIQDYEKHLRLRPRATEIRRKLAWLLATCPDATFRNGEKARRHARQACDSNGWTHYKYLDAFAGACAELGDFPQAIQWQTIAVRRAPTNRKPALQSRLELYRQEQPYRQEPKR